MDTKPKTKTSAAFGFIFVTIFIDVLGLGIIIPVIPNLLKQLGRMSIIPLPQNIMAGLLSLMPSCRFVFSPVLGNLSDRFGRRPILLISLLGFSIDYTFMAFAPTDLLAFCWPYHRRNHRRYHGHGNAYIADVSTGDKRAANFGIVGAASGLGFIIGVSAGHSWAILILKFPLWLLPRRPYSMPLWLFCTAGIA